MCWTSFLLFGACYIYIYIHSTYIYIYICSRHNCLHKLFGLVRVRRSKPLWMSFSCGQQKYKSHQQVQTYKNALCFFVHPHFPVDHLEDQPILRPIAWVFHPHCPREAPQTAVVRTTWPLSDKRGSRLYWCGRGWSMTWFFKVTYWVIGETFLALDIHLFLSWGQRITRRGSCWCYLKMLVWPNGLGFLTDWPKLLILCPFNPRLSWTWNVNVTLVIIVGDVFQLSVSSYGGQQNPRPSFN